MERSGDGVMLLISSGRRAYREYLMKGLAERVPLWLIDNSPPTWQSEHIVGHSVVKLRNQSRFEPDHEALAQAAADVARERPVLGVCSYDEGFVIATADIAQRLGVPGLTPEGADGVRNKHRTRSVLTAAGLLQPQFALAHSLAEAADAAERIGYPVVLKPRGMGASVGVVGVAHADELAAAFALAARAGHAGPPDFEQGLLVEEMAQGVEISIDGAVVGGEFRTFFAAHKRFAPPPYFEEIGHMADGDDPLAKDAELIGMIAEAHRALGVADGMTHTEVKLTPRGPLIIEVNGRLAGDLLPYAVKWATGMDAGHVAADVAMGKSPDLTPVHPGAAGVRFLYPPEDCRILDISLPEPGAVPGLVEVGPLAKPGTEVYLPPTAHLSRYGYMIATASTLEEVDARLDEATTLASVQYEPLKPSESGPERLF